MELGICLTVPVGDILSLRSKWPKGQLFLSLGSVSGLQLRAPRDQKHTAGRLSFFSPSFPSSHPQACESKKHMERAGAVPALPVRKQESHWLHTNLLALRWSETHYASEEVLNLLLLRKRRGGGFWHHSIYIKE